MADSSSSYRFIELRRRAFEQLPCAQGRAPHGLQRLDKAAPSFDKAGKRAEDEVQAIVTGEALPADDTRRPTTRDNWGESGPLAAP